MLEPTSLLLTHAGLLCKVQGNITFIFWCYHIIMLKVYTQVEKRHYLEQLLNITKTTEVIITLLSTNADIKKNFWSSWFLCLFCHLFTFCCLIGAVPKCWWQLYKYSNKRNNNLWNWWQSHTLYKKHEHHRVSTQNNSLFSWHFFYQNSWHIPYFSSCFELVQIFG